MIRSRQDNLIAGFIQHISVRRGNLGHHIAPKRQRVCGGKAVCRRRDRGGKLSGFEPDGLLLAYNVFGCAHFIDSARQEAIRKLGRMDRIAEGVLVFAEPREHRPLLVDLNRAPDGGVGHMNLLRDGRVRRCRCKEGEGDDQKPQQDGTDRLSFHIHLFTSFLSSE